MRKLVERHGISVNVQGQLNRTALHNAAMNGRLEVVHYLLEKGANKNAQANSGETPLYLAVLNGHKAVVEYLLDEGADHTITNSMGRRPIDIVRKSDIRQLLEDAAGGKLPKQIEEQKIVEKKQQFAPDPKVIDQMIAVGYSKGRIFEVQHLLYEQKQDYNNIGLVLKELTKNTNKEEKPVQSIDADADICKICFEKSIDSVLISCGHLCVCYGCASGLKNCPMCRAVIIQVVRTFKS